MLFSVEQAFVGKDEKRAPLKTPVWEAKGYLELIVSPTMPSACVEDRLHVLNIRYFEAATLSCLSVCLSVNCHFKQVCCCITLRLRLNSFENAVLKSRDLNPYVTGCNITSIMIKKTTAWENQSGMNLGPTIASRKQQVNAGK